MPVVNDVIESLKRLGGHGSLQEIYEQYNHVNENPKEATVRRTLQQYSSDSSIYKQGTPDYFFSVDGIGNGVWGLRNFQIAGNTNQIPNTDISAGNEQPERAINISYRIIRDTILAKTIKQLVGSICQLCDGSISFNDGTLYCEAHHIMPLGKPHNGPDTKENIIIVCPNCHAKCDYGIIMLDLNDIKRNRQELSQDHIDYHNTNIYRTTS